MLKLLNAVLPANSIIHVGFVLLNSLKIRPTDLLIKNSFEPNNELIAELNKMVSEFSFFRLLLGHKTQIDFSYMLFVPKQFLDFSS